MFSCLYCYWQDSEASFDLQPGRLPPVSSLPHSFQNTFCPVSTSMSFMKPVTSQIIPLHLYPNPWRATSLGWPYCVSHTTHKNLCQGLYKNDVWFPSCPTPARSPICQLHCTLSGPRHLPGFSYHMVFLGSLGISEPVLKTPFSLTSVLIWKRVSVSLSFLYI